MSKPIGILSSFFNREVIEVLQKNGYNEIWDDQWECIQKCVFDEKNVFISLPTGSGKTFPAILSIINNILTHDGKAVYVVPLKALAKQKYDHFRKLFEPLGISVGIHTGDYAKHDRKDIGDKDIIIATIEKLNSFMHHDELWLNDVSLFVIDEIQTVGDPSRGLTLEIIISEMIRKYGHAQRIGISAVIGNPEDFKKWFAEEIVSSNDRLIPLKKGTLNYLGGLKFAGIRDKLIIDLRGNLYRSRVPRFDPEKKIRYSNTIDLLKSLINQEKQCIVFTNSRKNAEDLSYYIVEDIKNGGYHFDISNCEEVSQLISESIEENTRFSTKLVNYSKNGVCFHHAGIQLPQREIIEDSFSNGKLKVIVSTPTLEQGVNLPCNAVIISDCTRWNGDSYIPLPVNSVINMMGRAGRPGYHEYGEAILVGDESNYDTLYGTYVVKDPEKVLPQLRHTRKRRKQLNGLIAANKTVHRNNVVDYLRTTLWFTMYELAFESFDLVATIRSDLLYLQENNFIKQVGDFYISTKFGKIVSDCCIDCETGLIFQRGISKLREKLEAGIEITPWSLFQLILMSSEINVYRPYDNEFAGWQTANEFKEQNLLLTDIPEGQSADMESYSKKSLLSSLLCEWIDEAPLENLTSDYEGVNEADIYGYGDMVEWLGDSLAKLSVLMEIPKDFTDFILEHCNRAVWGVKSELLEYVAIEGIRRKSARKLFDQDYSYNSLENLDFKTLSPVIGPYAAKKLQEHFTKSDIDSDIYGEGQIYDEVGQIIEEETNALAVVQEISNNNSFGITDNNLVERMVKITLFCKNELTWIHSDANYFRYFTNHGSLHSENVWKLSRDILNCFQNGHVLSEYELFLLEICCWAHDLGMLQQENENFDDLDSAENARKEHARRIVPYLDKYWREMELLNNTEKNVVSKICLHHSSRKNIADLNNNSTMLIDGNPNVVKTKLLAAILRLADALDADEKRLPRVENRNNPSISDASRREYKKHELVPEVLVHAKDECIYVQLLITEAINHEIYDEIKQKLNEEFDSVKSILEDNEIKLREIVYLEC